MERSKESKVDSLNGGRDLQANLRRTDGRMDEACDWKASSGARCIAHADVRGCSCTTA